MGCSSHPVTREEQKKLKELTKALPKILKEKIKAYPFKKKDFMIWYHKKDLFFDLLVDVRVMPDGKCYATAVERIKPLWLDDLLWDFLDMEKNKTEPMGLRATGAFTVSGAEQFKDKVELKEWSTDELEETVDAYLEHFHKTVQSSSVDDFYSSSDSSAYHAELRKSLSLVHNHQYQEALEYLSDFGDGVFKNGDRYINNAIRSYCEGQLSSQ